MWGVALVHTVFKIIAVAIIGPFYRLLVKLSEISVKDNKDESETANLLDERLLETPAIAVERSAVATYSMAKIACDALKKSLVLFDKYDAKLADETVVPEGKTVYLTFDDGPSDRTDEILAILDKYNVKATFFVMPRKTDVCYKRLRAIVDAGHTIGVHTYSHDYNIMYASVEAYLEDFNKAYEIVVDATGIKPDIFRFAGGSLNDRSYKIIAEMTRRGFTYYDWNASGDDSVSSPKPTTQSIIDNSLYWVRLKKEAVFMTKNQRSIPFRLCPPL